MSRVAALAARLSVIAMLFGLAVLGTAPSASAEAPLRLPSQITDEVDALDDAQLGDVQTAIDDLYTSDHVRLWVAYVADFDSLDEQQWAERTASMSSLGDHDVLLAVATVDRSYYLSPPTGIPAATDAELDELRTDAIEPALREEDWAGAAIATATGVQDALHSGPESGVSITTVLIVLAIVVTGVALVILYLIRRRRNQTAADSVAAATVDPLDTTALAALPIPVLHQRSKEVLVEMDNAVRTSAEELELARGEFGDEAVRVFDSAIMNAKTALAHAFAIRQQLDDAIPDPIDQQRDLLVELINSCARADRDLDDRVAEFDAMRDLLIDAPARLDMLTQLIVAISVRLPASEKTLAELGQQFSAGALEPVHGNVDMARDQSGFAERAVAAGRTAIALPPGKQGAAVGAIRSAEGAIAHAGALLDAVDSAADNIRGAIAALPGLIDEVRAEIATAGELASNGDTALAHSRVAAESALARAESNRDSNPLGEYTHLLAADVDLDKAIAAAQERGRDAQRVQQQLAHTVSAAESQVAAATDFVATRRGAVNATARTRLAEAERRLAEARRLATTEPEQALEHARAAAELGSRALLAAQADVEQWQSTPQATGAGPDAGAVLGGVLIDSILRGGFSGGGLGRRYGSGSSWRMGSPGSFGGASSSRRIGGGVSRRTGGGGRF